MKALNNFLIRDDNPSIDLFLLFLFKEHCLQYLEEITCSINFAQKWLPSIGHCRSLHGFQKILAEWPSFSMCRWLAIFSWSTKHSKQPKQESWLQRRKRTTTCLHLPNHEDSSEELNAQEYLPYYMTFDQVLDWVSKELSQTKLPKNVWKIWNLSSTSSKTLSLRRTLPPTGIKRFMLATLIP